MKIQKLNDTQLLWTLEKEDFEKNQVKLSDFVLGTSKAQTLFLEVMKQAEEDLMFHSKGYSLHCQLKEVQEETVIFSITRQELIPDEPYLICEFVDIDQIINLSVLLPESMELKNSLYKFDDIYLLFLDPAKDQEEQVKWCTVSAVEFTDVTALLESQRAFLKEHGECVIEQEALQKLKQIA